MRLLPCLTASLLLLGGLLSAARAQDFPTKVVTLIVPAAPGGAVDTNARTVGEALQELWGRPVIVEYKPGANTLIGTRFVAKAPADGYTLLMTSASFTVLPNLIARMPYEDSELVPVSLVSQTPAAIFVNPGLPIKNIDDLVSYSNSNPGGVSFGAPDATGAFVGYLFNQLAGTKMTYVPYKGFGPMATDVMGGHLQVGISGASTIRPLALTGKVKVLGVASKGAFSGLPDAPPIGKDLRTFEASVWFGLFAPRGTPPALLSKLHGDVAKVLANPAVRRRLTDTGAEVGALSQAEFATLVRTEFTKWKSTAVAAGVKPE
ncbi:MAG: tripartite tricarboxylate transporter substrate-binding protein [Pseudomonadota bacterium]